MTPVVISEILNRQLPVSLEGKEAILWMKENGSRNWRQMEWIGWYYEERTRELLMASLGGSMGKTFVNTSFDYYLHGRHYDFKAHCLYNPHGSKNNDLIINDCEAFNQAIANGGMTLVLFTGEASFDDAGSFKQWHDALKGKPSKYVLEGSKTGRSSRTRKSSFQLTDIQIIEFNDFRDIERGLESGWLKVTPQGRNSNGKPRPPKYSLNLPKFNNMTQY
jgi:hypothetical protein